MNELLAEGLQLMGVGMGVVFLFLGLLVGIITLVSTIIQKSETETAPSGTEPLNGDALLTLLSKAVRQYRADHHE